MKKIEAEAREHEFSHQACAELFEMLEEHLERASGKVATFAMDVGRVQSGLACMVIVQGAEDAMFHDCQANVLKTLLEHLGDDMGNVPAFMWETVDRIGRHLLGDAGFVGREGPWSPCSTSAMKNVEAFVKTNAERSLRGFMMGELIRVAREDARGEYK